jgi:hypothetical protein
MKRVITLVLFCLPLLSCSEGEMGHFLDNTHKKIGGNEQKLWCTPGVPCKSDAEKKQEK